MASLQLDSTHRTAAELVAGLRSLTAAFAPRCPDVAHRHRRPPAMSTAAHGSSEPQNAAHPPCPSAWILRALRRSRGGDTVTAPGLGSRTNRLDPLVDVKKSAETKPSNSPGHLQRTQLSAAPFGGPCWSNLRDAPGRALAAGSHPSGSLLGASAGRRRAGPWPERFLRGALTRCSGRRASAFSSRFHPFGDATVYESKSPSRAETSPGAPWHWVPTSCISFESPGRARRRVLRTDVFGFCLPKPPLGVASRRHLPGPLPGAAPRAASTRVPLGRGPPSGGALPPEALPEVRVRCPPSGALCTHPNGCSTDSRSLGDLRTASRNPRPRSRAEGGSTGQLVSRRPTTGTQTSEPIRGPPRCSHRRGEPLALRVPG